MNTASISAASLGALDFDRFEMWLRQRGASAETVRAYIRCLKNWDQNRLICNYRNAQAWAAWPVSPHTRRLAGYAARQYQNFSEEEGTPVDLRIPRLRLVSRPHPKLISEVEIRLLKLALRGLPKHTRYSMRVWIYVLDTLGIRRGETPMTWDHINFIDCTMIVSGKTGTRILPLTKKLVRLLKWLRKSHPRVPWIGAKGQAMSIATMAGLLRCAVIKANVPNIHCHLFRHRRLTHLCRSELGRNQLVVLAISGHAQLSSLQYYYLVSMNEKRAVLESISFGL